MLAITAKDIESSFNKLENQVQHLTDKLNQHLGGK